MLHKVPSARSARLLFTTSTLKSLSKAVILVSSCHILPLVFPASDACKSISLHARNLLITLVAITNEGLLLEQVLPNISDISAIVGAVMATSGPNVRAVSLRTQRNHTLVDLDSQSEQY